MDDYLMRVWHDLVGRVSGPMSFRFLLQPTMATIFAIRDGLKDAKAGRSPYFWTLFTEPAKRSSLLHDGWHSVAKVFILAIVLDVVYQLIVIRWIYPVETLIVAVLLAILPYLFLRGLINRIASKYGKAELNTHSRSVGNNVPLSDKQE